MRLGIANIGLLRHARASLPFVLIMSRIPTNDEPDIDIALLAERQSLLKNLVHDICHSPPPIVFGVHGDWGAGKTSFLQAVMHALTGSCPCRTKPLSTSELMNHPEWKKNRAPVAVWFEAWRYQNESAPIVALLHELRSQLSLWAKTADVVKKVGLNVWRNFMLAFDSIVLKIESESGLPGVKASTQIAPFQMAKAREEVQKARLTTPLPSNQIREALDEAFRGLLGFSDENTPRDRIVIFIDDLDRCSATAMFSLLESIKIYLNLKHCVFVLGINRHELERSIAAVLPEPPISDQRLVRAHEYLEKLCGNVIRLPYPSPQGQGKLVEKWLGALGDDLSREGLVSLVERHAFLPLNPRRVKMWCNTVLQLFGCRYRQLNAAPHAEELPALALVATLHTFHPSLHQALASAPSFLLALKMWCNATRPIEPELEVFDGILRIFVEPGLLTFPMTEEQKMPILKRAYGWHNSLDDDQTTAEAPRSARIPLLTDPSSLQYFHAQRLVADEEITEAHISPYLHIHT